MTPVLPTVIKNGHHTGKYEPKSIRLNGKDYTRRSQVSGKAVKHGEFIGNAADG